MNQEIIGKFIAECRKEKNMTQQELADKLGVTDRAISHWENGRRLPDYSLLKELCDTLSISINELFSGEKISNEDYMKKAEENMNKLITENYYKKLLLKRIIIGGINGIIVFIIVYIIRYYEQYKTSVLSTSFHFRLFFQFQFQFSQ